MNKLEKIQALMLSDEEANWRLGSLLCSEEEFMDVVELEKTRLLPVLKKELYNHECTLNYLLKPFHLPSLLGIVVSLWSRTALVNEIRKGGGYRHPNNLDDVYEILILPNFIDGYKNWFLKKFEELKYEQI